MTFFGGCFIVPPSRPVRGINDQCCRLAKGFFAYSGADVQSTGPWHEPELSCDTLLELGLGFVTKKDAHETPSSVLQRRRSCLHVRGELFLPGREPRRRRS